jgi:hypothetical protein
MSGQAIRTPHRSDRIGLFVPAERTDSGYACRTPSTGRKISTASRFTGPGTGAYFVA